jgi:thymidylate synthase ThyX
MDTFTAEEKQILERFFTNVDGPVFALKNLPEVVKGALFARYSRSSKDLRRLFLDEFVRDADRGIEAIRQELERAGSRAEFAKTGPSSFADIDGTKAERLYDRIFTEYGDDSVAQLGGAHLACEDVSNVVTKVIERGRLMAYLEQSTRYIRYDTKKNGRYRYRCPPELENTPEKSLFVETVESLFDTYAETFDRVRLRLEQMYPREADEPEAAYSASIRAKTCDILRGLLPAAALSSVGIFGTGQAYERLLLRMFASPYAEARDYGQMMLTELKKIIPSFVRRVEMPDRGGLWIDYLRDAKALAKKQASAFLPDSKVAGFGLPGWEGEAGPDAEQARISGLEGAEASDVFRAEKPDVRLVDFDPDGERKIAAAILFEVSDISLEEAKEIASQMDAESLASLIRAYAGRRANRRHMPGRAFEATTYCFEIVSDYGAFRDLQRHRMLTIEWQPLTPQLGFSRPPLIEELGEAPRWDASMERAASAYLRLRPIADLAASYVLPMAYRIRYVMRMNAREALYVIELRTSEQAHPEYRSVCLNMARLIEEVAQHRAVRSCLDFLGDKTESLERRKAELAAFERRTRGRTPTV